MTPTNEWICILAGIGLSASAACGTSELGNVASSRQVLIEHTVPKEPIDGELRQACGEGGPTAAGARALLRRPYLQRVTSTSTHILWTTPVDEATTVRVTTPDGRLVVQEPGTVDEQAKRAEYTQYDVAIAGLEPGTIYCYSIAGATRVWLEPTGFRTAPATDGDARITVIGDLGTQTSDQFMVRDELSRVASDLVLVAGDLAYENGTLEDHEANFFEVYQGLLAAIPFFVVSGNHDYAADGAIFREVFSLFENGGPAGRERWYSFDWGPAHIVALDTEVISDEQAGWLDADLASTDKTWRIVFMHRPAFSSGWHGSTARVQKMFVPLFEKHGVQLVLAGHDHNYERTHALNGVTYVVVGSSGRGTRPVGESSFTVYSEAVAHFGHITISGNTMRFNAIDATGVDFDSVTLSP